MLNERKEELFERSRQRERFIRFYKEGTEKSRDKYREVCRTKRIYYRERKENTSEK